MASRLRLLPEVPRRSVPQPSVGNQTVRRDHLRFGADVTFLPAGRYRLTGGHAPDARRSCAGRRRAPERAAWPSRLRPGRA